MILDLDGERWVPVEGWPGYDISNMGRLRSWKGGNGRATRQHPKLIGTGKSRFGHFSAKLCDGSGDTLRYRNVLVHVLVLETFVGPRPDGLDGCHNNGDPADNRPSNLRWATTSSNMVDTLLHGTSGVAKLSPDDIPTIWGRLIAGDTLVAIAADYRVATTTIYRIRARKAWTHITSGLPGGDIPPPPPVGPAVYVPREIAESTAEIWRPIPGWESYRVSNFGDLQTCWTATGAPKGRRIMGDWRPRATSYDRRGYRHFRAGDGRGGGVGMGLHVAILMAFAGPRPAGMVACHNDGDPRNNRASNLRWDTPTNNARDRFLQRGAILRPEQIPTVRARLSAGDAPKDIAAEMGVGVETIRLVRKGETWSYA